MAERAVPGAAPKPRADGIRVIRQATDAAVRRLQVLAVGTVRVISDNPAYAEQRLNLAEEQGDFSLVGRVLWSPRMF